MQTDVGLLDVIRQDQRRRVANSWWARAKIEPPVGQQLPDGHYTLVELPGMWKFFGEIKNKQLYDGTIKWFNGGMFKGKFDDNSRPKEGSYHQLHKQANRVLKMVFEDKCQFKDGEIVGGVRKIYEERDEHGEAFAKLISTYNGQFKRGKAEGVGVYKTAGILYKGEFKNNLFEGVGKLTVFNKPNSKDEWIMEGSFKQGKFIDGVHSIVRYYDANGDFRAQQRLCNSFNKLVEVEQTRHQEISFEVEQPQKEQQNSLMPGKTNIVTLSSRKFSNTITAGFSSPAKVGNSGHKSKVVISQNKAEKHIMVNSRQIETHNVEDV